MTWEQADFPAFGPVPKEVTRMAALVLLEDQTGRTLCQLRDDNPGIYAPGYWSPFGGGVEAGETLLQAALREMQEETALVLQPDTLRPFGWVWSGGLQGAGLFVFVASLNFDPGEISLGEGAGFALFTDEQLAKAHFVPSLRPLLAAYLAARV